MTQPFAPRMSRLRSWARTALMVLGLVIVPGLAQGQVKDSGKPDPGKMAEKEKAKPEEEAPRAEIFVDANSKKALMIFEPLTYVGVSIDQNKITRMVGGTENLDRNFLKSYVDFFTVELSTRANINAIIKPPANLNEKTARAMERAVNALTDPMIRARANNTPQAAEFLKAYIQTLFESRLVKLLEGNLLSRIDAMIVLGMAGSREPSALDLYIAQLKKPDQVIWVKSWAARGLTRAGQDGRLVIEASRAIQAAEALIALLEDDPKLAYPVQVRAIETLGSLRIATARRATGQLDVASVVMKFLADPAAKLEVRAYAAWALGMMKVPAQTKPYNFMLVGHEIGELAFEIGQAVVEEYDDAAGFDPVKKQISRPLAFDQDKDEATRLTSLLLFQVFPSLDGQDGATESGLLKSTHPSLDSTTKPFVSEVEKKVKAITLEAYELLRAGGVGQLTRRNSLDAKLEELSNYLAKNPAKDRTLITGGPNFPEVAGAP